MSAFISKENVLLNQHAATREEVLRIISNYAVELGAADDADAVYEGFMFRENLDKTGLTEGFAIPHCKTAAIKHAAVIPFKNDKAIEWPSFDEQPVDIAMALLVPESEAGDTHIRLLSKTAVLLMDADFKKLLRESDDAEAIAEAINKEIQS